MATRFGWSALCICPLLASYYSSRLPVYVVGAEKLAEALIVLRNLVSDVCIRQFEAKIPEAWSTPGRPFSKERSSSFEVHLASARTFRSPTERAFSF